MYVSIRDAMLRQAGFDRVDEGLRFFNVEGVELDVDRGLHVAAIAPDGERARLDLSNADDLKRFGEQSERTGLRAAAFFVANNFKAEDVDAEIAWVARTVEAAARLGVPAVRIDALVRGGKDMPRQELVDIFVRCVGEVLRRTDGLPVDLGIENHGFPGNDPAFLDGLMDAVGSPRLGMTLDSGNFYWAGNPRERVYQILEHLASTAKHTHIKNICYPAEMRDKERPMGFEYGKYCCPIPEGDLDHARLVSHLKAAGYDRDLCIEDESLGKYDQEGRRRNLQAAADYLRGLI